MSEYPIDNIRVVHFAPAFTAKGGGIFEVVNCLVSEQCKIYDETNVKVIGCNDPALQQTHDCPTNVAMAILPYNYNYKKFILELYTFIKTLKECDVIHIHGAWSLQFLYLLPFVIFNCSQRIIYQPHGLLSSIRYKRSRFFKFIFWHLCMKILIRKSSVVVSTSNIEEDEFIFSNHYCNKIVCIPNAIANEFFEEPLKQRSDNNFLFLSQIIPIKGLDLLLTAFSQIIEEGHKVSLTIGGYGEPSYIQHLHDLVHGLNLSRNVIFIGPVARDDRVKTYDSHRYFILPSMNESFGLVVGEALARGCVSFISEYTPWAKITDVPNLITVLPEQQDIYIKLKKHLNDKIQYLESDAIISQNKIAKKYAWSERVEHFTDLYTGQINE